jgi:transcriptional regulator with XRE-family HTH domain
MVASTFCHLKLTAAKPRDKAYPIQQKTLGDRLRTRRLDLGLLQREVAKELRCNEATITNWELNRVQPILQFLPRIVEFLGYDPWVGADFETLGQRFKQQRRRLGLSRRKLAALIGIDPSNIAGWETGKHRPNKKSIDRIDLFLMADIDS